MLQPVGPLPASVYWRRRALAFAVVLLVLLLAWLALPGDGGGDGRRDSAGAVGSPAPDGGTATSSLTATPPAGDPGRSGGGGTPTGGTPTGGGTTAAPTGSASAIASRPAATPSASAPKPCPDSALALRVLPERPSYRVGETPVLDLVVRNVSAAPCVRDLGAAHQEVLLFAGSRRLWSSNDCYPGGTRDPQVLGPGDSASFSVTWSGLSSRPKCAGERVRVGPGRYTLVGRLGTLVSGRAPLTLS